MIKVQVKWWNDSKGYGFVTDGVNDIYCHYTALHGDGFKTLREGQIIDVELLDGPKGLQVARCDNWAVTWPGDANSHYKPIGEPVKRIALLDCGHAYNDDCLCD